MYIYGGVSGDNAALRAYGDVWKYDLTLNTWSKMTFLPGVPTPPARFSHAGCLATVNVASPIRGEDASSILNAGQGATGLTEDSMVIFGGRNAGSGASGSYAMFDDVWYFGLDTHSWRKQTVKAPVTRSYHSVRACPLP
jgi:N-acetylneuraminic acid mutarotase